MWLTYAIIAVLLLMAELIYFRIADKCIIVDKPNDRSSHSTIVLRWEWVLFLIAASIVFVGATNIINFMDGINGITGGYAIAVILPLIVKNEELRMRSCTGFIDDSYLIVELMAY